MKRRRPETLFVSSALGASLIVGFVAPTQVESAGGVTIEQPAVKAALTDRDWQLVRIMSMDDTESVPADRSLYTLRLNTGGDVQIRADCNRASGNWTSTSPGKLEFGTLGATKALCPPDSLHDAYMAQFPWVRSYVTKDGNLFLATMADGSIIEFEPAGTPVAATVLGQKIYTDDAGEMQEAVLTRLFDRYATENSIEATDAEIDTYIETTRQGMRERGLTAEDELSPDEAAEFDRMRREMGRSMIERWKLNKALYEQYGGRIIFQQFGPEPLDAYRRYLEERQQAGDFTIHNEEFAKVFWDYFTNESKHSFYEPGSPEEKQAFAVPFWEGKVPVRDESAKEQTSHNDLPLRPDDGGPLHWEVTGVDSGLRLRAAPSTSAGTLSRFPNGAVLHNLGCERGEGRIWCDVQPFRGGPRGYVAADYLTPAISPNGAAIMGPDDSALRAGQHDFDATGIIPCAQAAGQPMRDCRIGVARTGGGYATVVVTKPDGHKRAIFFQLGIPTGADSSEADGFHDFSADKQGDLNRVFVGPERYEIPDAVVLGG
jgi:heat shock protein HslJ